MFLVEILTKMVLVPEDEACHVISCRSVTNSIDGNPEMESFESDHSWSFMVSDERLAKACRIRIEPPASTARARRTGTSTTHGKNAGKKDQ